MRIEVGGTGIETEVTGVGPTVALVHGWPDTHALWRHQSAALAGAGYRVVAPDLRGFGASDPPADLASASIPVLAGDLLGVLDHLGCERAHLVGHDWGAALAWAVAAFAPERVDHLVALSVGHPSAFRTAGLAQREKSWYMLLFQFEGVAEQWLSADGFANFRTWSRHPEADEVASRLSDPAALTASLAIYRSNLAPETLVAPALEVPPVEAPTMGIWSTEDIGLVESQMQASADLVKGPWRYERLDGVGHWIPLEAPARLNALLLDFLPAPG